MTGTCSFLAAVTIAAAARLSCTEIIKMQSPLARSEFTWANCPLPLAPNTPKLLTTTTISARATRGTSNLGFLFCGSGGGSGSNVGRRAGGPPEEVYRRCGSRLRDGRCMGTILGVGPVVLLLDIDLTLAVGSCMDGALPPAANGPEGEKLEGGGAKKPLSRELGGGGAKKPLSLEGATLDENVLLLVDGWSSMVRRNAWANAPMLGKRVLGS